MAHAKSRLTDKRRYSTPSAGIISATVRAYVRFSLRVLHFVAVIYIDQPVGTGFSFGTVDVNSTFAAAPPIWTAFQVLFESKEFAKYQSREYVRSSEMASAKTS